MLQLNRSVTSSAPLAQTRLLLATIAGAAIGTAGLVGTAQAQSRWVRFIATELETQATALPTAVPSTIDALLQGRISASPNGQYWSMQVLSLENGVTSRAAISGTKQGVDFAVSRLQTMPPLGVAFEASASGLDTEVLVNNAGDVSISGNLQLTTTNNDEAIVLYRRSDQTYSFIAREGSPIPGLTGENYGGSLDQKTLFNDGRLLYRDTGTVGSLPSAQDEFLFIAGANGSGHQRFAQAGVLVPTGQTGTPVALQNLQLGYGATPDGSQYITRAILTRPAPNVVAIRNGAIQLELGQALPGAAVPTPAFSTAVTITDAGMGPSGDWWISGRGITGGAPWLIANGQIVFTSDADFPGGLPGERVSNIASVNFTTRGDLCYTVSTGTGRSAAIVLPAGGGAPITALQTGDAQDLNNNGDPTDDAFNLSAIFNAWLCDDGTLYVNTRVNTVGDIIGWVPVTLPCGPSDIASPGPTPGADGELTADDVIQFISWFTASDANADIAGPGPTPGPDGEFTADDVILFIGRFTTGC